MSDIYCDQIIPGKLEVEVIWETDQVLAFHHSEPYWERHVVLVPKKHVDSLAQLGDKDSPLMLEMMKGLVRLSASMEKEMGECHVGTNLGKLQTSKHLHWYLYAGKRRRSEDGSWIPGD